MDEAAHLERVQSQKSPNRSQSQQQQQSARGGAAPALRNTVQGNNSFQETLSNLQYEVLQVKRNWALYNVVWTGLIFIIITALEAGVMISILAFQNQTFGPNLTGASSIIAIYFGLFIFGLLFQLVGAFDAKVIAVSVFNLWTVLYSIVQIFQVNKLEGCSKDLLVILQNSTNSLGFDPVAIQTLQERCYFYLYNATDNPNALIMNTSPSLLATNLSNNLSLFTTASSLEIVICLLMILASSVGLFISWRCYNALGWNVYRQGADMIRRKMLERYHLFLLLLKINVYFFLGLAAQVSAAYYFSQKLSKNPASLTQTTWVVGGLLVLLVFAYYVLGYIGSRWANKYVMFLFIFVSLLNLGALGYLIVNLGQAMFQCTIIWLTSFVILQILASIATIICACYCMLDFNNGFNPIDSDVLPKRETQRRVLSIE